MLCTSTVRIHCHIRSVLQCNGNVLYTPPNPPTNTVHTYITTALVYSTTKGCLFIPTRHADWMAVIWYVTVSQRWTFEMWTAGRDTVQSGNAGKFFATVTRTNTYIHKVSMLKTFNMISIILEWNSIAWTVGPLKLSRNLCAIKFCEWSSEWDKIMAPSQSIIKQQQLNYLFAWQPAAFAHDSLRVLLRSKDMVIVI